MCYVTIKLNRLENDGIKLHLLRTGALACFMIFCWSHEEVSAATSCGPYGEINPNQNPSR
ncbi:hypothetical protein [Bacillus cereus]|uniref:hypothetical protein n=1 Tax=Bacillus cereus TaxID=1396 RepID=UPI001D0D0E81|nr:hypothetical protein [Bacillus cereus]